MAIPSDVRDILPQQDEPILAFIQRTPPMQSAGFNTFPMHAWFSCKEPSTVSHKETLENVMRRTIPSRDFIIELEREFGQQWLDGKRSIVDPRYNQGHDGYPFWVLTVWREILTLAGGLHLYRSGDQGRNSLAGISRRQGLLRVNQKRRLPGVSNT